MPISEIEKIKRKAKKEARELEAINGQRIGNKTIPSKSVQINKKNSVQIYELSEIFWIEPNKMDDNPYNKYPPLEDHELIELTNDIKEKGVIVPLILRATENILICGHNRKAAAIKAKIKKIPYQRVLTPLNEMQETELMKSENDKRRGGNWSKEKKIQFINDTLGEKIHKAEHGGDRKNRNQGSLNLAKDIEEKSKGKIPEGTAKRLIAEQRKKSSGEKQLELKFNFKLTKNLKTKLKSNEIKIIEKKINQINKLWSEINDLTEKVK